MGGSARLVTVATYTDPVEAHVTRGRLEAEGISATVAHEHHIWANWLLSNALGGVKVQVLAAYAERAMDVLNRARLGEYALPDDLSERLACPCCGGTQVSESKRSWTIAFIGLFAFSLPLPWCRDRFRCANCRNIWTRYS
jgi:hypothetical protein